MKREEFQQNKPQGSRGYEGGENPASASLCPAPFEWRSFIALEPESSWESRA